MLAQLKEDIRSIFDRDPAARNSFEVITTYPGVHQFSLCGSGGISNGADSAITAITVFANSPMIHTPPLLGKG